MDNSAFINTYVDVITGRSHELLNELFQLKTQFILLTKDHEGLRTSYGTLLEEKDNLSAQLLIHKDTSGLEMTIQQLNARVQELNAQVSELTNEAVNYHKVVAEKEALQNDLEALNNKASHYATALNQLKTTQTELNMANNKIAELEAKLKEQPVIINAQAGTNIQDKPSYTSGKIELAPVKSSIVLASEEKPSKKKKTETKDGGTF